MSTREPAPQKESADRREKNPEPSKEKQSLSDKPVEKSSVLAKRSGQRPALPFKRKTFS